MQHFASAAMFSAEKYIHRWMTKAEFRETVKCRDQINITTQSVTSREEIQREKFTRWPV